MTGVYDLKNSFHIAMHAMGAYHKLIYTNTKEAFEYWYEQGLRIFEVDLAEAADNRFVCLAHHMEYRALTRLGIVHIPESLDELTSQWFLRQKLFPHVNKGLTPLSLKDLTGLLRKYDDVIILLDLFGQFGERTLEHFSQELTALLEEDAAILDRLLVETYNEKMTAAILKQLPEAHIIYGFDDTTGKDNAISVKQLQELGVEFVSFPWRYSAKYPEKLKELAENEFVIFSRTADDRRVDTMRTSGVNVPLLDCCYGKAKNFAYIYVQERIMSGLWFSRLASARLLDFFHGIRKRLRRKRA